MKCTKCKCSLKNDNVYFFCDKSYCIKCSPWKHTLPLYTYPIKEEPLKSFDPFNIKKYEIQHTNRCVTMKVLCGVCIVYACVALTKRV